MVSVKRIDARTGGKESTRPAKEMLARQLMLLLLTRISSVYALNSTYLMRQFFKQIIHYNRD